ncbi:acyloxyacyl hydrolase [Maribellus sediminis]|uniref:acyloxyacyl hydrolase n=1 Tax=Maribellus sediminis TaxID=2696285 RepID=UPI001430D51E|nr:acyloxyacyl hydrolase [Maribellus sediminis]
MRIKEFIYRLLPLSIIAFSTNQFAAHAQESIDISYSFGSILVHSPLIEPISANRVDGFSFTYTTKNKLGAQWKRYYNYPNYGFTYKYKSYNYPEVLGHAHSLTTFMQFSFLKQRRVFDVGFRGKIGLAYLNKIYDKDTNPLNTAVSSHLNIAAETQFYSKIRLHPVFIEYSYGLNHFSNGLVKSPNLGINSINHQFSIGTQFEKPIEKYTVPKEPREPYRTNEYWLYTVLGTKEVNNYDQRFTFFTLSLNYSRQISMINKLGVGMDFIRDGAATQYARQNFNYTGTDDLSYRFGPNLQTEFLFGRTNFFAAYGFYFGNTDYYSSRAYYKVGSKIYFNDFFAIVLIRAIPLFRAEALLFGVGYRISGKKQNAG